MTSTGVAYCRGRRKRLLDGTLALVALVGLAPFLLAVALAALLAHGSPVLFRHPRVGRDGRLFDLIKFRSMRPGAPGGLPITGAGDRRVTGFGRWLRRTKIDELPQLLNVLAGTMSFVGPRPEVARYVERYTPAQRRILEVPPGLTDPASLAYRDEEAILGRVPEAEREAYYLRELVPKKLALSLAYAESAGLRSDLRLIARTGLAVLGVGRA
ncbi:MAG TPA: sugar transferase [Candidatus Polarisedimenticolia bacterium]|nr:sugar transferase [Candidatus Polarisedimenticolia bacterium]